MKLELRDIVLPALARLPRTMTSIRAEVMMLAICQQESGLVHRKQLNGGTARGLAQFERIGVTEVLRNPKTRDIAIDFCWRCGVPATTSGVYHRLESDDILAVGFARLALWRHPGPLPGRDEAEKGWQQYFEIWRPGKPRREKWDKIYERAWDAVLGTVTA